MLALTFYLNPSAYSISNQHTVQHVILYKQLWWQWSGCFKVFYILVLLFQCALYNNKIYKNSKGGTKQTSDLAESASAQSCLCFSPTLIYRLPQLLDVKESIEYWETLFNQIWLNTSLSPFLGDIDHPYAKFISTDSPEHTATEDNHTKTELCSHCSEYVKCLLNNEYVRQRACLPRTSLLL